MRFDDSEDCGEAQAAPAELRREEGIEDPGLKLGCHALPGVGNCEDHVGFAGGWQRRNGVFMVISREFPGGRRNRDGAWRVLGDRLCGIDDEVHDYLLELCLISFHAG